MRESLVYLDPQRSIGAVIIELAYGQKVFREHGNELVEMNIEGLELMSWAFQQIWLPNILPISTLWYLPIQLSHTNPTPII
jgi:hypothetical protein